MFESFFDRFFSETIFSIEYFFIHIPEKPLHVVYLCFSTISLFGFVFWFKPNLKHLAILSLLNAIAPILWRLYLQGYPSWDYLFHWTISDLGNFLFPLMQLVIVLSIMILSIIMIIRVYLRYYKNIESVNIIDKSFVLLFTTAFFLPSSFISSIYAMSFVDFASERPNWFGWFSSYISLRFVVTLGFLCLFGYLMRLPGAKRVSAILAISFVAFLICCAGATFLEAIRSILIALRDLSRYGN